MFLGMKKTPPRRPLPTLRDAYKVRGFRARAKIDSYDEITPSAFVITLDRRSKKRCAADAGKSVEASTINAGGVRVILDVETDKSLSTFRCVAWPARAAA
jgi:hypothetical protein